MDTFGLPDNYRPNPVPTRHGAPYWTPGRVRMSYRYQYHVYRLAAQIAKRQGLKFIADVGCGPGTKLAHFFPPPFEIHGFDLQEAIEICRNRHTHGTFTVLNLAEPELTKQEHRHFDLVICADVIEHLENPRVLFSYLRTLGNNDTIYVISTPDRDRLHGSGSLSPTNQEHVREWTASEFSGFVKSAGFSVVEQRFFPLHKRSANLASVKSFMLELTGSERACPNQVLLCRPGGD